MKTNTFNFFRNAFAIVGFFIIACSVGTADDTTVEPEPPVQSNNGKYQISVLPRLNNQDIILVLNTSTGKTKYYTKNTSGGGWTDQSKDITFTH